MVAYSLVRALVQKEMSNGALMLNSIGMVEQLVLKEKGIARWCVKRWVYTRWCTMRNITIATIL
jgi:hypothetical protein